MRKVKKILKVFLYIITIFTIMVVITSSIYNRIGNCKVDGEIKGLGTRLALFAGVTNLDSNPFFKVIFIVNDKFSFNAKFNESGHGRIITWNMLFKRTSGKPLGLRSKMLDFSINPNEKISINGTMNKYSISYLISGNKVSEQTSKFAKENIDILVRETQLELLIDSLEFCGANENLIDSIKKEFGKTRGEYNNQKLEYAIKNPNQEVSALFLGVQDKDTIIKYLPTLNDNVLSTENGRELKKRFLLYKQTEAGNTAPNIIESGLFNLASLKGKYVVLDFWGTWCGFCIKGFPKMRDYYSKYHAKVEFVGIACKDKKSVWTKCIKDEGLQWTQLLNGVDNNDFAKKYNIECFPTKVLIDKEGKIIKIFEGESNDFYEKLDNLIQE